MNDPKTATDAHTQLPRITIMIPTYRQEHIILEAVDSALAQDYPNLEVIVADDASPDNTTAVVAVRKDPRLRYHRNPSNLGRVANYRNTLYTLATGDWVVNLDGDDYYTDKRFISDAIKITENNPEIVMVVAGATWPKDAFWIRRRRRRVIFNRPLVRVISGQQYLYDVAHGKHAFFHMAALYRRREALSLQFYRSETISSDAESLLRLAVRGKVACLNRDVGSWRITESNDSLVTDVRQLIKSLDDWLSVCLEAVERGMPIKTAKIVKNRLTALAAYRDLSKLLIAGHYAAAAEYFGDFKRRCDALAMIWLATRWRLYGRLLSPWWRRGEGKRRE